ncbi:MAG: V-type ATP synthase subunit E [Lachnospiraceae bacterium]|nr:V-type ATP synthase subunit E [Lachnospiraceae bacterium]
MANIDKITEQILEEAKVAANRNIEAAKAEASDIIKKAEEECKKMQDELAVKEENARKSASDRAKSAAQLKKRQAVLNAKQEIIADIIKAAYEKMLSLDDKTYFEVIEKMLKKFSLAKTGEIHFSEKDLKRMPAGYESVIEKAAKENGGTLTLSTETKNIDGGFILVYGGIEENCSIQAMFHDRREFLADKVHELIF